MRNSIFYLMLFTILSCCQSKPAVSKELVYSTLNQVIQNDTIFAPAICGKFYKEEVPGNILNKYFKDDKAFIKEQLKMAETNLVDTGKLCYYVPRQGRFINSAIDKSCSRKFECAFSYPVYSNDLKTVIVSVSNFDQGFSGVYKLENNKWVLVDKYSAWIY